MSEKSLKNVVNSGTVTKNAENMQLTIPEENFAQILLGFLGKKQTLSYQVDTAFLLRLEDIAQFHYLLTQKIEKEQHTFLSVFNITIQYNDNTKRQLTDIKNLESFFEVRDVVATDVTLQWEMMLEFPEKKIENQTIEISFSIKDKAPYGNINLNIEHTNQAWGD
ncbi:hypothetical protein QUF74_13680 [Candidatus Halobeggiatoa sp. HSG11]|nr:hypothetical protein [Candidatus Halobeggiatoa sp. HSG11]